MTTLRGIAQPSDCPLTRTLLAYWRKLLVSPQRFTTGGRAHRTIETAGPPAYTGSVLSAALTSLLLRLISVVTVEQLATPSPRMETLAYLTL